LEILLLQLGRPVSKDRLIELLWEGSPPPEALASLESYVSVLRRNLQPGSGKAGPLRTSNGGYVMDREMVDLDVDRFDVLVRLAEQAAPPEAYLLLIEALQLATAPLLGDELRAAWAEDERSRHAIKVTAARILAAETASELNLTDDVVRWANVALAGDPLSERAWTVLILGLEQGGRHAEGLRAYDRCRRAMETELGCAPGPKLQEVYVRLLRATADGLGELSDVLSALLTLHDQLKIAGAASTGSLVWGASSARRPSTLDTLREAGEVVNSFLRRALSAA
jgi:DNA-binding SARP family transcriptional activator